MSPVGKIDVRVFKEGFVGLFFFGGGVSTPNVRVLTSTSVFAVLERYRKYLSCLEVASLYLDVWLARLARGKLEHDFGLRGTDGQTEVVTCR